MVFDQTETIDMLRIEACIQVFFFYKSYWLDWACWLRQKSYAKNI